MVISHPRTFPTVFPDDQKPLGGQPGYLQWNRKSLKCRKSCTTQSSECHPQDMDQLLLVLNITWK